MTEQVRLNSAISTVVSDVSTLHVEVVAVSPATTAVALASTTWPLVSLESRLYLEPST